MSYNVCLVLLAWLGVGAQAQRPFYSLPYQPPPPLISQYRAQDIFGQFDFGYTGINQFRAESGLIDGSVRGSYGYVDPRSKLVQVDYVADAGGFRVLGANNLPTVPANPPAPPTPQAVDYTPEVAAARAEFEKSYKEQAAKAEADPEDADSSSSRRKRSILLPQHPLYAYPPAPALKVRVAEVEKVKDVISPASTQPVEFKEVEKSVPLAPVLVTPTIHYTPPPFYGYFLLP